MSKQGKAAGIGSYYQPFHTGRRSIFAVRPLDRDIRNKSFTKWELLTDYMKHRFVSRAQVKKLAQLKYIAVSSFRNRLYVCEICSEEIDSWLL